MVLTVRSAVACELHLISGLEALGEQRLRQLPTDERAFVEAKFVLEKSRFAHHTVGTENSSLDALETVRGPVSHYVHHPSPKVAQLSAKRNLLGWCDYFSWEVGDWQGGREEVRV